VPQFLDTNIAELYFTNENINLGVSVSDIMKSELTTSFGLFCPKPVEPIVRSLINCYIDVLPPFNPLPFINAPRASNLFADEDKLIFCFSRAIISTEENSLDKSIDTSSHAIAQSVGDLFEDVLVHEYTVYLGGVRTDVP